MVSLVGGDENGSSKAAEIVSLKVLPDDKDEPVWDSTILDGFHRALSDVRATVLQGRAVILISISKIIAHAITTGVPATSGLTFISDLDDSDPPSRSTARLYRYMLDTAHAQDVVVIAAAGNDPDHDLMLDYVRRTGGPNSPLIIVGGVDNSGAESYLSPRSDLIDIWAPAEGVKCARSDSSAIDRYKWTDGTSGSAAIVAGLAAAFLSDREMRTSLRVVGQVGLRVKAWLRATAEARVLPSPAMSVVACNGHRLSVSEWNAREAIFTRSIASLPTGQPIYPSIT